MPIIYCILLGLILGSFLNLVIDRWPQSCIRPASHCPACGHELRWFELIPVLSWLVLRGRCRSCGSRINPRYPCMELLTAAVFGLLAWRFGPYPELPVHLLSASLLIAIAGIDVRLGIIPNRLVLPGLAVSIPLSIFILGNSSLNTLGGALDGFVSFVIADLFTCRFLKKHGMGMGDAKLAAMLGALVGFNDFSWMLLLSALLPLGIWLMSGRKIQKMPFGPGLASGYLLWILFGKKISSQIPIFSFL